MQVEYKTEKGTVIFVKVPDDSFSHWQSPFFEEKIHYHTPRLKYDIDVHTIKLDTKGLNLVGLTSEITEEQVKMILTPYDTFFGKAYKCKCEYGKLYTKAIDSFKSIMQHLQVYEVNPYDNYECENHWCDNGYIDMGYNEKMRCQFCQENEDKQDEIDPIVGKWIVLFKPN